MNNNFLFKKENFYICCIGIMVLILGFILISGGGSKDQNVFNPEIFNFRRLFWGPLFIIISFVIQVYAILYTPKTK